MYFGALGGLNDPLSVYNEAIYTFYRTLKRWTLGTYWAGVGGSKFWSSSVSKFYKKYKMACYRRSGGRLELSEHVGCSKLCWLSVEGGPEG